MDTEDFYVCKDQSRFIYDADGDQKVFEYIFQTAFKDSASLNRNIFFTSYLSWTGKVRELALGDIGPDLVKDMLTGHWGLVTNWADLKIVDEISAFDWVLAKFRIGEVHGAVIPLKCEFYQLLEGGDQKLVAVVEQDTTWVEIVGHGKVRPADFPGYLAGYLSAMKQKESRVVDKLEPLGRYKKLSSGELLYHQEFIPVGMPVVHDGRFLTSLEESNLVGNVYYGNYFIWQGRVRDRMLYEVYPEWFTQYEYASEMVCTHSRLNYLRDAMPFDEVVVEMSVTGVWENKVDFVFQYYRALSEGAREKLAVGYQTAYCVGRSESGNVRATAIPEQVLNRLIERLNNVGNAIGKG